MSKLQWQIWFVESRRAAALVSALRVSPAISASPLTCCRPPTHDHRDGQSGPGQPAEWRGQPPRIHEQTKMKSLEQINVRRAAGGGGGEDGGGRTADSGQRAVTSVIVTERGPHREMSAAAPAPAPAVRRAADSGAHSGAGSARKNSRPLLKASRADSSNGYLRNLRTPFLPDDDGRGSG